jgi:amino acid transporter
MASVFGGQVQNPAHVYKRAVSIVVALTAAAYILPLLATLLSGSQTWTQFDRGTYEAAAQYLGGEPLRALMVVCSFATCMGLHVCGVFCCSTEISGMAENKLVPLAMAVRNAPCGSPHNAILTTLVIVLALMPFNLDELLPVANTFGSLVAASIFLAAVQLRRKMPYVTRPVRVPGGIVVIAIISLFPVGLCGYIIFKTLFTSLSSSLLVLGFAAPAAIFGAVRSYGVKIAFCR